MILHQTDPLNFSIIGPYAHKLCNFFLHNNALLQFLCKSFFKLQWFTKLDINGIKFSFFFTLIILTCKEAFIN